MTIRCKIVALAASLVASLAATQSCRAADLTGTYQYPGNIRNATISKLEIARVKGQTHVHVWFYGRPDDVDWGDVVATEYHCADRGNFPDLLAVLQHNDAKTSIAINIEGGSGDTVKTLRVQSWTSYAHPDERHKNEYAGETLDAIK